MMTVPDSVVAAAVNAALNRMTPAPMGANPGTVATILVATVPALAGVDPSVVAPYVRAWQQRGGR